ncbi:MAG: hypothetical protein LC721_12250, partial [Actinobacteria bacterium]|nr:hypothetical protein [Actinomycetota bacterium]
MTSRPATLAALLLAVVALPARADPIPSNPVVPRIIVTTDRASVPTAEYVRLKVRTENLGGNGRY